MTAKNTPKTHPSQDEVQTNIKLLKQLLPAAFTADGQLDINVLQNLLTTDGAAEPDSEKFGINWAGKSKVFGTIRSTTTDTLRPNVANSVNFDTTQNLFIEGDNLDALKILQRSYFGKVKMIYIDPPYNTGNDFVYNDDFKQTSAEHTEAANTHDAGGNVKRADGLSKNSKDAGRYHSNWLNMMYPRLHLARNLLKDDGVIFVSIDDNEVHNLRSIMNEIFGEENFIGQIVWQKKYAASNDSKGIAAMHDYIIVYAKSENFARYLLPRTNKQDDMYKYDDSDGRGKYRTGDLLVKTYSAASVFPIINPKTKQEFLPRKGNSWRGSKETIERWLLENRIFFGKDGKGAPQLKRYLSEVQQGLVPVTWWTFEEAGHNDTANKEIQDLFGSTRATFDTPKPTKLIKRILQIATRQDDIVLDFFAGSGTTAHAVMQLNAEDGGNRKYILVQLPEQTDDKSEAHKAGYATIADIARERIRRAGQKVLADNAEVLAKRSELLDIGFKDYTVAPSNFVEPTFKEEASQTEFIVDNIKPDTTDEDLLTQLRLLQGKTLDVALKTVKYGNLTAYMQDETIFTLQPNASLSDLKLLLQAPASKLVLLDRCFANSKDMTNFEQEYQALGSTKTVEIY